MWYFLPSSPPRWWLTDDAGAVSVEYALIIALVTVVLLSGLLGGIGQSLVSFFERAAAALEPGAEGEAEG